MNRIAFAAKVGLDPSVLILIIEAVVELFKGCGKTAEDVPSLAKWAKRPVLGMWHRAQFRKAVAANVTAARVDAVTAAVLAEASTLTPAAARALMEQ